LKSYSGQDRGCVGFHEIDFPLKKLLMDTTSGVFVEISYLKTDMCKCESTHRHESRTQLADSLKACSKPTAPVAHPRTVTRKSSIGIFSFVQGSLTLQILT